ncbi:MAG: TolC family protein [Deltaproteobacteria bacterium]|nr:TolC family protein [Deltaproteobacteria bacterium]
MHFVLRALPIYVFRSLLPILSVMAVSGCSSLVPEPLTTSELVAGTSSDRERNYKDVPALNGPLTLEEAIARSVKYNLDRRSRMMEEALSVSQFEVSKFDLLPKVVASAGYRDRNKELISRSKDSVTGLPSLANPSISSDRDVATTDLSFTWSLLDFGQSYYVSKQNADRALIAGERRRKALHNLIQDVRTAFWRTACAQKLHGEIQTTLNEAEQALNDSRAIEAERLRSPIDALRYQRQLLENLRLLESIEQELSTAKVELASLTNLPLAQSVSVVEPDNVMDNSRWLGIPVERMEEQAILSNADVRESFYNTRIASLETRRALLKLFPGISFSYSAKASDDSYLIHQHWTEAGAQLSLNLLGLLSAPSQMRLADAGVALSDQRRMATQMAVLAQVHVARLQYGNAVRQFDRADAIWKVDSGIADHVTKREQVQTQTRLDRVSNQTAAILSQLRRYHALSQVQAAAGKLQATLGLEASLAGSDDMSLTQLTEMVAAAMRQWNAGALDAQMPAAASSQ